MAIFFSLCFFTTAQGDFAQSVNTANSSANNNRANGPLRYRDITAYMPAGGCDQSGFNGVRGNTSRMAAGTSIITTATNLNIPNGCGIFIGNAGPNSTLSPHAQGPAPKPNVIGKPGSTTVHYKIAAMDANFGTSAASAAITITDAPAKRTPLNYVGIYWTSVANAVGYLVYSDASGKYAPLASSFACSSFVAGNTCGIIDKGAETHSFSGYDESLWPQTPPTSPTNQALITTVKSGGGTTTMVLASSATNSVTQSGTYFPFVMPDVSMFINSAITAAVADGSPSVQAKGTVFIPQGTWITSTIPLVSAGSSGVKIVQSGLVELFGLPIGSTLAPSGFTGRVSIEGTGGMYQEGNWALSCSVLTGYVSLGAIAVVQGPNSGLDLGHLCLAGGQTGIVQDSQGDVTTRDVQFYDWSSSGPMLQVDANAFFSNFDRTNWNDGNNANNSIPAIWFLGLTNNGHTSTFNFKDNTFVNHTIRMDSPFPGGYFGNPIVFTGENFIENNYDIGFINNATCGTLTQATIDNLITADAQTANQTLFYSSALCGTAPGSNINIHGQTNGFSALVGSSNNSANPVTCRAWTYENPNSGGVAGESVGYWGTLFGAYSGCDNGITMTGYDVQTTEVLTSGGNDGFGPAGEQIIGHVFRRPVTTVTPTNSGGSLKAGTYYIRVTMVDVAGRESAPSIEVPAIVTGSTGSIAVSSVTGNYFPAGCNIYFGTTPGGENNHFASTSVTNGTCTYKLQSAPSGVNPPRAVGNAMRTWFTAENNGNSWLFCGSGGGMGTGFLGFNLTAAQYGAPPTGVRFPFNGGVHSYKFFSASETATPAGIANVDELYADSSAHEWKKIENHGTAFNVAGTLSGTTGNIGGSALTPGHCASGTVSVTGATTSMTVSVSPNTFPGDGFIPWAYVSANGTVTVKVCATAPGTPASSTYNVRVIQ